MFTQRLEALRNHLRPGRFDAFLLHALPDIRYLTGFTGSNAILFVAKRHSWLVTDGRYTVQVSREVHAASARIVSGPLFAGFVRNVRLPRSLSVGVQKDVVTISAFDELRRAKPSWKWKACDALVGLQRLRKSAAEIEHIRRAVQITDGVFDRILRILSPGVRESEVAAEISYLQKGMGAEADAFEPIVASGRRGAQPHARATDKKIKRGEFVTLDFGCRVEGYHSDMTRTIAVGSPSPELRRIYKAVLHAQLEALSAIRAGVDARIPDRVARKSLMKAGYGRWFRHSLGHGLGLELHEFPRLAPMATGVLEDGNVVTVEPGVYLPDAGGVRIEDDVVVRPGGIEVLTQSPKDLIIV